MNAQYPRNRSISVVPLPIGVRMIVDPIPPNRSVVSVIDITPLGMGGYVAPGPPMPSQ